MNLSEKERIRRNKLIDVQTKHFSVDAKNEYRKVAIDVAINSRY